MRPSIHRYDAKVITGVIVVEENDLAGSLNDLVRWTDAGQAGRAAMHHRIFFDLACLDLAIDFAGVDHIVAGSDYPHMVGSLAKMVDSISGLALTEEEKNKIASVQAAVAQRQQETKGQRVDENRRKAFAKRVDAQKRKEAAG